MSQDTTTADVVVVGGGISGSALATVLARAGLEVLVVEASTCFVDRVRGESLQPWGVREAQQLGVATALEAAGAHWSPTWLRYGEGGQDPSAIPVGLVVAGVEGTLNLAHPAACQALLDAATDAGASVRRGVTDVTVVMGPTPTVRFGSRDGNSHEVRTSLVVGADGRASLVRRHAGITLHEQQATGWVAGLLMEGLDTAVAPADHDVLAETDQGLFLLLHQGNGLARGYHMVPTEERTRYAGAGGAARFVADAAAIAVPEAAALAAARPAGPCGAFPGTDTWTEHPFAEGVVLIGDAAGHNDPTIGCGLSIALRDARLVGELVLAGARRPPDFAPYGRERSDDLARLRLIADVISAAGVERAANRSARRQLFGRAMAAMDLQLFPLALGMFAGPETVPVTALDPTVLDRIRAA